MADRKLETAYGAPDFEADDGGRAPLQPTGSTGFMTFDPRSLLHIIRRYAVSIAAIVAGFLVLGVVLTLLLTPKYSAVSRVLIEQEADKIIEGSELRSPDGGYDVDRFLQTQVDVIHSRSLAERTVEAGNLASDARFFEAIGTSMPVESDLVGKPGGADQLKTLRKEAAINALQASLSTDLPMNSRIVSIKVVTADPVYSAKLANSYAQNFIQSNLDRKFDSSAYARNFLADQLEEARTKVEASERQLNQYASAAGLIRVSADQPGKPADNALSVTNDQLVLINQSASAATTERIAAQDRWRTIADQPLMSIPQVLSNPSIQQMQNQKAELQGKLAQELVAHLDSYPTVRSLRSQINDIDSRIQAIGKSIRQSVYLDYQSALAKEQSLTGQVGQLRGDALKEQDRGVQYTLLKRVADTNRTLYDSLLGRFNELTASAGVTSNNITLVDSATIPSVPSSPRLSLNIAIAFVVGLIAAALFVFLRETFDDSIRTPDDVEAKLAVRLLGLVPLVASDEISTALSEVRSSVAEAYYSIVANLRFLTARGYPRSMLVTSAGEGEGKSTSALAIAIDLSRMGKSVLLIDADLRRPTIHKVLSDRTSPGLTSLITGEKTLEEVVQPFEGEKLHIMTALPIPHDPSLLLASERMEAIINEACRHYECVILDCPPLLGLSDTISMSKLVEGVLFVVDASTFHRGAIKSALRRLSVINSRIFGVVLTKFDIQNSAAGYQYYAYNYYTYGRNENAAES